MRIRNLTIKNFRGIPNLEIEDFRGINLILGKNNASKTSILEAIFMLIGISNPELVLRVNSFRNLILIEDEDFRLVFFNLNYKNEPEFKAVFDENDEARELVIKPITTNQNSKRKLQKYSKDNLLDINFDTSFSEEKVNGLTFKFSIKQYQKQKKEYESKITFEKGSFTINEDKKYKQEIRGVFISPQIGISLNLEKELEELIITKQYKSIIQVLKKIDSSIEDIAFGTNKMIYIDIGIERLVPINIIGDGIRRLLSILLSISNAKNGILLIDEIDNGLHFSTLKVLWSAIIEASKEFNVQLVVTTHNQEVLKYLKEVLEEDAYKDYQDEVRSYTIRRISASEIKAYKYDFPQFEFSVNQEIEIR
jgi:AAA15 family ATPase/GTPase